MVSKRFSIQKQKYVYISKYMYYTDTHTKQYIIHMVIFTFLFFPNIFLTSFHTCIQRLPYSPLFLFRILLYGQSQQIFIEIPCVKHFILNSAISVNKINKNSFPHRAYVLLRLIIIYLISSLVMNISIVFNPLLL